MKYCLLDHTNSIIYLWNSRMRINLQFIKILLLIIIIFIEILFTGSHEQYYISTDSLMCTYADHVGPSSSEYRKWVVMFIKDIISGFLIIPYTVFTHTHIHSCPSNSFIISIIHLFLLHQFIYILYTSNSFTIQYFSNTSMIH